jgi:hypothetical protein
MSADHHIQRPGATASAPAGERRDGSRTAPWRLLARGPLQAGQFVVAHEQTGRTCRLSARTEAEAEAQIELLNCHTLEIDA